MRELMQRCRRHVIGDTNERGLVHGAGLDGVDLPDGTPVSGEVRFAQELIFLVRPKWTAVGVLPEMGSEAPGLVRRYATTCYFAGMFRLRLELLFQVCLKSRR